MSERDIRANATVLVGAIDQDDDDTAKKAMIDLVVSTLVDINRIANAIEAIALIKGATL